jgi:hypothetical protein
MTKTIKVLTVLIIATIALSLAACGGGGGGGNTQQPASTIISGVVSKGIIKNGTVKINAVTSGVKSTLLATTTTDTNGRYSASIGTYTGAILVEASGSYIDEATGLTKVIDPAAPLRAALGNASGTVNLSVTALTDIAVSQASSLTPTAINNANALTSSIFKIDIVATIPVDASPSAMASATQAQKDYTLALAAVSQVSKDSSASVQQTIAAISGGITSAGADTHTVATVTTALTKFLAGSTNQTGVTTLSGSSLTYLGKREITLAFSLLGSLPVSGSGGAQFTFTLPAGVYIQAVDGELPTTIIKASGIALSGGHVSGNLTGISVTAGLITSPPVNAGEFMTITCLADPGVPVTSGMFMLSGVKVTDINGASVSAATVGISVR